MIQLISYGFTTVENPLSDGGNFAGPLSNDHPLQVISSGVCEGTSLDTGHFSEQWWAGSGGVSADGNWANDQYAEVTLKTILSGSGWEGPAVRLTSNGGYILLVGNNGSNNVGLWRVNSSGAGTQIGSWQSTLPAANDVWRLQVVGSTFTVFQNGSSLYTFSDSTITSGNPGICSYANAGPLANFQMSLWAAGANQAAAPTFSPNGGTYTSAQTVTISSTSGGTIYYTTDGTMPTHSSSSISSGSTITVSTTQTVKAIASVSDMADSTVASASFTINASTPYSVPDCRNYATFPNSAATVNATKQYTGQTSSNSGIPPTDSRVSKPVACGTYPQNSRTPGTYGPDE